MRGAYSIADRRPLEPCRQCGAPTVGRYERGIWGAFGVPLCAPCWICRALPEERRQGLVSTRISERGRATSDRAPSGTTVGQAPQRGSGPQLEPGSRANNTKRRSR